MYNLLDTPDHEIPDNLLGHAVDVRDVARAHVLAITAPPLPPGPSGKPNHKRLIISNQTFKWDEIVKIIRENFPDERIDKRLPKRGSKGIQQSDVPLDNGLAREAIGFEGYIPLEKTVVDSFRAILDWEGRFKSGFKGKESAQVGNGN